MSGETSPQLADNGVERINGIKLNFNTMADAEVLGVVDHQLERFYHTEQDLLKAMSYAALRGLLPDEMQAELMGEGGTDA